MGSTSSPARLPDTGRAEQVRARIEKLGQDFSANVVAATHALGLEVGQGELASMPKSDRERARRRANARGLEGHLLTLDPPSHRAALAALDDRLGESFATGRAVQLWERDFAQAMGARGPDFGASR